MKILSKLDNTAMIDEVADKKFVTDEEKLTWNSKADKTYVDSKVQTDVPADAKFTDTITSVNGQTGDIELTGDDLNYFDYQASDYVNVGSTLNGIADAATMFMSYIIGTDYEMGIDPTLKKISEMFTLVLGDYQIGAAPSLGEIVEEIESNKTDLGEFTDTAGLITHVVTNQLETGYYTFDMGDIDSIYPNLMLLTRMDDMFGGVVYTGDAQVFIFGAMGDMVETITIDFQSLADKADITYVDSQDALKADKAYVDNKVKTDVPVGAKFTDTVYSHPASHPASMITESSTKRFVSDTEKATWNSKSDTDTVTTINGKTGAISKADIVALGINDGVIVDLGTFNNQEELITHAVMNQLPTGHYTFIMGIYPYFMLLREEVEHYKGTFQDSEGVTVNFRVTKTGQINYLFDVNILDDIADLQDLKADKTYVDNKVKTDVPVGAKFTDTVTTINGKTGAISKADIVALGIPAQDTNTTYSEITTAEIDAGSASTLRTMTGRRANYIVSKANTYTDSAIGGISEFKGQLQNHVEKLTVLSGTSPAINLTLGNVFKHTLTGNTTYSITGALEGAHSFTLEIVMGATARTITFPSSIKWDKGEAPDLSETNKTYILTFMSTSSGSSWYGMLGGAF